MAATTIAAKVLIAASEFEPLTNVGNLGRVVQNLSVALNKKKAGAAGDMPDVYPDVRVALPKYNNIPAKYTDSAALVCEFKAILGRRTYPCAVYRTEYRGVTIYLVSCGDYFERNQVYSSVVEDIERYSCFCNALLMMLPRVGFIPDIIQCHDWHMSYIPILYKAHRNWRASNLDFKTLFVIHNMQYQGVCSRYEMLDLLDLSDDFFTPSTLEFYGQANSLKGGLLFSDKLATVSPNFSSEIQHAYYGENLEGIIRARSADIYGILCGIDPDIYNPETDDRIYVKYDAKTVHKNKPINKVRLQKLLGFEQNPDIPLLIVISDELDYDKGVELIRHVFDDIVALGAQIILASKGKPDNHEFFIVKAAQHQDRVAYVRYIGGVIWDGSKWAGWNEPGGQDKKSAPADSNVPGIAGTPNTLTETMLIGGSDALLRPSRVEPCGEKHLIALKYGTLPIVRETGGLKDVVISYKDETDLGNGFSFANYNAHDMLYTISRAVNIFRNDRGTWNKLIVSAMQINATWDGAAEKYRGIYKSLTGTR